MLVNLNVLKIGVLSVLLTLIFAACAPTEITTTPEAVIATPQPATSTPEAATPVSSTPEPPTPTPVEAGNRPIQIAGVEVQIGEGSPIPVDVVADGNWPDLCAQVAQIEQRLSGSRFEIEILASPAVADCPPDMVGLSYLMTIPLNMTSLPAGTYTVAVNGVETSFEWSNASSSALPASENPAGELRPLTVEGLAVEIGRGSPLPVEVVASGTWPDLCAQLAEVSQQLSGDRIEISLSASPADPVCPADPVGIPFRVAVPLNMVEVPFGTYTVVVNGVEIPFEWMGATSEPLPVENLGLTVAYIGTDGNVWVADASGGPPRQITTDAAALEEGGDVVSYNFPKISYDGRYIAVRRDAGVPISEGVRYEFGLWVYDTETGESQAVFEDADSPPAGHDWKPGTHLLAYGIGSDPNYFTTRDGKPDATLATGINAFDIDSGESSLLVEPENDYTLILPTWSPNGGFLSFDELLYMEGRGPFAYYDFEAQQYINWDEPLGNYDWSPDGSQLVYDRLSYTATGTERIFTRARVDGSEEQLSPDPELGYDFYPVYSPDGLQIAYLTVLGGPETVQSTLMVHDLSTGEARELGSFESVWYLDWSSDGRALVFSAGPFESQQVYGYDLVHEEATVLAEGSQPSIAKP